MKKILLVLFLLFTFNTAALAATETSVIGRPINGNTIQGLVPEVDGLSNASLRTSINGILKSKAEELGKKAGKGSTVNYEVVFNKTDIFSVILFAENGENKLYSGVNIDASAGKELDNSAIVRDDNAVKKLTGATEFILADGGLRYKSQTTGAYSEFISYAKILPYINISNAERIMRLHRVTNAAFGSVITINAGEPIGILLEANRSTGYTWSLVKAGAGLLELGKAYVMSAENADRVGAPGLDIVFIGAENPGTYNVQLEYKRSWDKFPITTGSFDLVVK